MAHPKHRGEIWLGWGVMKRLRRGSLGATNGTVSVFPVAARRITVVGILFGVVFLFLLGQIVPVVSFFCGQGSPSAAQLAGDFGVGFCLSRLVKHRLVVLLTKQNEGVPGPRNAVGVGFACASFLSLVLAHIIHLWRCHVR